MGPGRDEEVLRRLAAAVIQDAHLTSELFEAATRFPSYRDFAPAELHDSLKHVTLAYLEAVVGDELAPEASERLCAMFLDRLRRGVTVRDVRGEVRATGDARYLALQRAGRSLALTNRAELQAVDRAGLRVGALTSQLEDLVERATERLATRPTAGTTNAFVHRVLDTNGQADLLQREARRLGILGQEQTWGVLSVVPRRGNDLATATTTAERLAATTSAGTFSAIRQNPLPHAVALVLVAGPEQWCRVVEEARGLATSAGAAICAPSHRCALGDLRRVYAGITPLLPYAAALPRIDSLVILRYYRDVAAIPDPVRANIFNRDLGALVGAPRGGELLAVLDALWLAAGFQTAAAPALGLAPSSMARRRLMVRDATGLDWERPYHLLAIGQAIVCRWLAAAFLSDYDPRVFGPPPDLVGLYEAAQTMPLPRPGWRARRQQPDSTHDA